MTDTLRAKQTRQGANPDWHAFCEDCGYPAETCFPAWVLNDGTVVSVDDEADPLCFFCPSCGSDRAVNRDGDRLWGRWS